MILFFISTLIFASTTHHSSLPFSPRDDQPEATAQIRWLSLGTARTPSFMHYVTLSFPPPPTEPHVINPLTAICLLRLTPSAAASIAGDATTPRPTRCPPPRKVIISLLH